MNVASSSTVLLVFGFLAATVLAAAEPTPPGPLVLVVQTGLNPRKDTPVRVEVPGDRLGEPLRAALADGPKPVHLRELRDGSPVGEPIVAQAERVPDASEGKVRLTWILAGETPADAERRFRLESTRPETAASPWSLSDKTAGALELWHGKRMVFRYNLAPVSNPGYGPIQHRDAYLHPALTPSGALITGDFSSSHPHHRGFFLAYTKTEVGPLHPDFWNIHAGSGKIHFDRLDETAVGPVTARIKGWHRWEAKDKQKGAVPVLRERWDVEAYDIPGSPYWLFDLTSTQQAIGEPLKVHPYRYGGMAYRGPEPFVKGKLDVLTSAGLDRRRRRPEAGAVGRPHRPDRRRLGPVCRRDDPRPPDEPQHPDGRADPPDQAPLLLLRARPRRHGHHLRRLPDRLPLPRHDPRRPPGCGAR